MSGLGQTETFDGQVGEVGFPKTGHSGEVAGASGFCFAFLGGKAQCRSD
jgi:hypothetical protein